MPVGANWPDTDPNLYQHLLLYCRYLIENKPNAINKIVDFRLRLTKRLKDGQAVLPYRSAIDQVLDLALLDQYPQAVRHDREAGAHQHQLAQVTCE